MKRTLHHTALGALLALTALGCTEERPYEEVNKINKIYASKAGLCGAEPGELSKAEYLYLPSTVEASRTTTATRPHWMGDEKIVKLLCNQRNLKVVDLDVTNTDFGDNPTNARPVLNIPIAHGTLKCDENADGKCNNKEVFDETVTWTEAKDLQFKVDEMEVQEVNFLPEQITELIQPSCLTELSTEVVRSEIESDAKGVTAINITLQRNYQTNIRCAGPVRDLADLGFSVRNHYSVVRLDTIADKNYQSLSYTRADETTFGYFDVKSNKYDVDNNEIEANDKSFVKRWNPNKTIVYHMNKDFLKPENVKLIAATKNAVAKINEGLKAVGAKMQIDLKDPDTTGDLMTGDIRVNSIVLEDDPLAMNVIGYGPSAANPYTGELLHGRTVMYLGTIRKFVKRTYDEFVEKKIEELELLLKKKEAEKNGVPGEKVVGSPELMAMAQLHIQSQQAHDKFVYEKVQDASVHQRDLAGNLVSKKKFGLDEGQLETAVTSRTANVYRSIFEMPAEDAQDFLMHKNCMFTTDMMGHDVGLDEEIDALIAKLGLKSWEQLNKDEKLEVLDVLTPFVWTPVLVHELGHNLGLRHNFAGSEDKANFYTKEELIDMGLTREFAYSSVMDYSYSTINELPVLGKYDLAALRFGYAEAVETNKGIMSIHQYRDEKKEDPNSDLALKPYDFCTDEHVALNPNCNRFDEGGNLLEITQHHIRAHSEGYQRNNFRNGRRNFSQFDEMTYIRRLDRSLGGLRLMFERYETIKNTFGLADSAAEWESIPFLKELKDSVKLSAEYLASIITTPDLMCAVSQASNPFQIIALVPLSQLSTNAATCYDDQNVRLNPQFVIVGHAGKLFQSKKDPRNGNPYIDQIDVQGVWVDKLMAINYLTGREMGVVNFDKFQDNFLDIADVAASVDNVLRAVTTNQVVAPVTIHTVFGQSFTVDFPVSMYDASEQNNGHRIMDPLDGRVSRFLALPSGNPSFQKVVIDNIKSNIYNDKQFTTPGSLYNALDAFVVGIGITPPRDGFVNTTIGTRSYAAPISSSIAANAIVSYELSSILEAMGDELIDKVLADIEAGKTPAEDASELEKIGHQLGAEILQAFKNGVIQSSKFYAETVRTMAM